jgi:hypothetical protein
MTQALIIIDNTFIRKEARRAYRAAATELARIQHEWTVYNNEDQPAFRSWYQLAFADLLRLIQKTTQEVYEKQNLVESVMNEAAARGIGLTEAYENVMEGRTWSEAKPEEDANAAKDLFEEALRDQGIEPESLDSDDYEQRYDRFKADIGLGGNQQSHHEDHGHDHGFFDQDEPVRPPASGRIRDLYRKLALKLHPDVAETSELSRLWLEVQRAYENRNLAQLEMIWKSMTSGKAAEFVEESIWDLRVQIEELFQSIRSMKKKLKRARKDYAWGFSKPEPERKKKMRKSREKIQRELRDELAEVNQVLNTLTEFISNWADHDNWHKD